MSIPDAEDVVGGMAYGLEKAAGSAKLAREVLYRNPLGDEGSERPAAERVALREVRFIYSTLREYVAALERHFPALLADRR